MGSISSTLSSNDVTLGNIKYSFLIASGVYCVAIILCRSQKSPWDAISARKVLILIRTIVIFELVLLVWLLFCYITYGSPINTNPVTPYMSDNKQQSFVYGFGRPVLGIVLIGMGLFSDMHLAFRLAAIIGSSIESVLDGLSAFQIKILLDEVIHGTASSGVYPKHIIGWYYWRDIISIANSITIVYLVLHFSFLLLWSLPRITYQNLEGGELDRCEVMRKQRMARKLQKIEEV